jgi:hypothetical protein
MKKKLAGILYADTEALSESDWARIFYKNNPDLAYKRIEQLDDWTDRLTATLNEANTLLSALLKDKVNGHAASQQHRALKRQLAKVASEKGIATAKMRSEAFATAVQDRINAAKPGYKTRHIVAEIMQLIEMDSAQVADAIKTCGTWRHIDLKFPRKTKAGEPYSKFTVRDKVEELLRHSKA